MRTDTEIQMFSHEFPHLFAAVIDHKIINISNAPVFIKFKLILSALDWTWSSMNGVDAYLIGCYKTQ